MKQTSPINKIVTWYMRRGFLYTMLLITETARWYRCVYWLRRRRLKGIGITIIDLRRSDDRLGFIMEIHIPVRRCHFSEWRPWWPALPVQVEMSQLSLYIYLKFDKAYKLHFGFGVIFHRGTIFNLFIQNSMIKSIYKARFMHSYALGLFLFFCG